MYSVATEPSSHPDLEILGFTETSVDCSRKPKVLAAWTSLKSARELSEFCTSVFESVGSFDFEVVAASELEVREITSKGAPDYRAIVLAFSPEDTVSPGTEHYLRSLVVRSVQNGERSTIVCREGLPNLSNGTNGNPSWNSVLEGFAKEFDAYVTWDSRSLRFVREEGVQ